MGDRRGKRYRVAALLKRASCSSPARLRLFPWHAQAFGDRRMNANSDTIILQWHSEGGRDNSLPAMADVTVFADGRVEVGPRFAHGTVTTHQLSDADLAALHRFVFEEQDIWSIDSAALARDVTAAANAGADAGARAMPVHPGAQRWLPMRPPLSCACATASGPTRSASTILLTRPGVIRRSRRCNACARSKSVFWPSTPSQQI